MKRPAIRISVVIVSFNSRHLMNRCLRPISSAGDPSIEILLWDNASSDGTADYVREAYPDVHVMKSDENLGFARGNNALFPRCKGKYVLLLNPDAFVRSVATLHHLADVLDGDDGVGMVGPQLLHEDGSHQVGDCGWEISAASIVGHMLFLHRLVASWPALYLSNPSLLQRDRVDVDWVCGACTMIRRSLIDAIGGLDSKIFMYGEDVEWGLRARAHGARILYLPKICVLHLQGGTQRSDTQLFSSTKWLDNLAQAALDRRSRSFWAFFKGTMTLGLAARGVIYTVSGALRRSSVKKERGRIMFAYVRHVSQMGFPGKPRQEQGP